MTPEELKALLADVLDPNKAPEAVVKLSEKVNTLIAAAEASKAEAERQTKEMNEVRDINARLSLLVTGISKRDEPDVKELEDMDRNELREFFSNKMKEAIDNAHC